MNLWHQRLIIFIAKVLAVILGWVFIGYFLYYNLYFKQDALIKYVPKDAIAYAAFRITPELEQTQLLAGMKAQFFNDFNLPEAGWEQLNQLTGNNFSLAVIPNNHAESLTFSYLLLFDFGARKNIDEQYLEFTKKKGWSYYVFTNQTKSRKIVAITSTEDLLNKVKQVAAQNEPSLAQDVGVVLNLKKFVPKEFWARVYCDLDYLASQTPKISDWQIKLALAAIKSNNSGPLFLGMKNLDNKIVAQNNLNPLSLQEVTATLEKLPSNLEYSLSFSDLPNKWKTITNWLQNNDAAYYAQLLKNKEYLEGVYNFSWENELLPALSRQIQIIKTTDNQILLSAKVPDNDLTKLAAKIESIIKNYLATNSPVIKPKKMPDYTYINQVLRDTSNLDFIEDQVAGLKIKLLDSNGQEYAYILSNNSIILANSRQIINDNLQNDQILKYWQATGNIYDFGSNFSQNTYLSGPYLQSYISLFSNIKYLLVNEDKSSGAFRLILE
ncbi:MAG: hypothetical protein NTX82_00845 [Candidatus Parcubacteria bacterium]|nr:hypothetical protein [Candidatus Parcubacteria bacterium]